MKIFEQDKKKLTSFMKSNDGLMEAVNIVLALVMVVIVGAIGIFIAQTTVTATNLNPRMLNISDTANMTANANITAMNNNFLAAGQTGSSFIVILIIAAIGGLAIAYLMGMLGGTKRGL